jgi:hypothetical protein
VPAVGQAPIAALPVPVTVLVRVPVGVVPIGIGADRGTISGVHCGAIVRMDNGPIGPAGMISTIGGMNGRAASGMDRRAITSLDRCAVAIMSCFPVFSFVCIGVKSGGCHSEQYDEVFHKRRTVDQPCLPPPYFF